MGNLPYISVNFLVPGRIIKYLLPEELRKLTETFQSYYDSSRGVKEAKIRARYWSVYLVLRFTGARLGEILSIDDKTDIDWRASEIRLINLKRHNPLKKAQYRQVPVPNQVISELARLLMEHPELKGRLFKLDARNFRRVFSRLAREAGIPEGRRHPHVLRHSRAIELLRAGIPVTAVQQLLGHAALTTTAIYLQVSATDLKNMLKEKGLI